MKKSKISDILLILIFPILFLAIIIPKIISILEERRNEEFINTSKIILINAEKKYLQNKHNNTSSVITCNDVIKLNSNYGYCSIYIEKDKINLTLEGKGKFENMNICSKSIDKLSINDNCNDICFNTNIYDVKKPYVIESYNSCINNAKDIFLNNLNYTISNLEEFCSGKLVDKYVNEMIKMGLTEEYLLDNKIINGKVNNVCVPNEFESSCFSFKIYTENKKNYAEITDYNDNCGNVVKIPSQILGVDIEVIGDYAFSGKKVNNVIFPSTIKRIGTGAFQGHGDGVDSNLIGVYLSGSLDLSSMNKLEYIDYFAFADNNITSIKFPNSIKEIGSYSFSGNRIIGELDLSNTKLKRIDSYSFSGSDISSIKLPTSINSIGYTSFAGNNIKELDLSNNTNLTIIEEDAFADNDITIIKLPKSIKNIKIIAFFNNKISGELDLSLNENLTSIGENAFKNNNIESVILPSNIETIDKNAFIKNGESNINLKTIINTTEKKFNWYNILGKEEKELFDYGIIDDIEIKKEP